ncbi:MAG: starch-binding protein [Clostridiales bacterium]|nr:starch-binding protein [Clostridiales bacterium]
MFKKATSLVLAALILTLTMAVAAPISASASVTSGGTIYLQVPASWKTYSTVYCHLWKDGGSDLYSWQTRKEKAVKVSDGLYSYEIPAGADVNMVIWSNDIGMQTYDLTMGDCCIGDTVYSRNEIVENPVDSNKSCELVYWTTHTSYGPKYQESSIGTQLGETPDPEAVVCTHGAAASSGDGNSTTTTGGSKGKATSTTGKSTTATGTTENVALFAGILAASLAACFVLRKRNAE